MKTYSPYEPDQLFLMPPSSKEWLPENHLAYFVSDIVERMDLSAIEEEYKKEERGYPPYHPVMMVKVLLYGYSTGVYSSRRIAKRLLEDVAFRILAAGNQPDFRTISDFRKRHLEAMKGLFVQIVEICREAGLVKLGHIALDGTKIKANASKHKAMSYSRMKKDELRLRQEIDELLRRAEQTDKEEDRKYGERSGDELPEELARRESRLKKIKEAMAVLEQSAKNKDVEDNKPADDRDKAPKDSAQRNFTDPESRIMLDGDKALHKLPWMLHHR